MVLVEGSVDVEGVDAGAMVSSPLTIVLVALEVAVACTLSSPMLVADVEVGGWGDSHRSDSVVCRPKE